MKVRAAVARVLAETGAERVFGVLGGGNMYIVHELVNTFGLSYTRASREDGAVLMGHGYAQVSGKLGISTVTYGPGLTNAVTAITEAARSRSPVIVLTGAPPLAAVPDSRQGMQLIDQETLLRPTGARYCLVRSPESAVHDTARAIRTAVLERRVVVLAVPSDIQDCEADYTWPRSATPMRQPVEPDPDAIDRAAGLIASSARPVVLAGRGAVLANARRDLVELAAILDAPLATTLGAKDFFRGEPNDLGICGTLSSEAAGTVISESDCVIAAGASLNRDTTMGGSLVGAQRVVQIDSDPMAFGAWLEVSEEVLGDVAVTARAVSGMLRQADIPRAPFFSGELRALVEAHSWYREYRDKSTERTVDVRTAALRLDVALPADRSLITDGGRFLTPVMKLMRVPSPGCFLPPLSFAAVGSGLAMAIGACFARPDHVTVLVTGDGGLMMSIAELNTAVQNRLNLAVIVMNDGAYGQEIYRYRTAGMSTELARLQWPDFAAVADSFGAAGTTVRNLDELDRAVKTIGGSGGPVLIDVRIDPDLE